MKITSPNTLVSVISLVVFSLLVPTLLGAKDTESVGEYLPESIMKDIHARGASAVVHDLYGNEKVWNSILQKIASGKESWLKIAVALRPGSDAGSSQMLSLAVGEALEHDPENVLRLTIPAFDIAVICGGPDIDDERYNSLELAIKAIENRAATVASIKDVALSSLRKTCLQFLEDSKKHITRFYGSGNK